MSDTLVAQVGAPILRLLSSAPPARAGVLAAEAHALLAHGRVDAALATAREAHATLLSLDGIKEFEPMIRLAHAEASWAAGLRGEARQAIAAARDRVQAQAAAIGPADVRARFLTDVPDNARIAALARAWLEDHV